MIREGGGYTYPTEQLYAFENWEGEKLSLVPLIHGRDNLEQEDKIRQEAERLEREQKLREEAAARAVELERSRVAAEAEAKKKQEELLAQQEQERIAAQGDKGRIMKVTEVLRAVITDIPEMNSAVGQHTHKTLTKQLGDIVRMLEAASKDL